MSDFTTVPLEARAIAGRKAATRIGEVKSFLGGLLFAILVTLAGTFLVAVALVIGVVGSPFIAAAVAYVALRQRRASRERAWAT